MHKSILNNHIEDYHQEIGGLFRTIGGNDFDNIPMHGFFFHGDDVCVERSLSGTFPSTFKDLHPLLQDATQRGDFEVIAIITDHWTRNLDVINPSMEEQMLWLTACKTGYINAAEAARRRVCYGSWYDITPEVIETDKAALKRALECYIQVTIQLRNLQQKISADHAPQVLQGSL